MSRKLDRATSAIDVVIIGAGVVGCAIARELSRYEVRVVVCEAAAEAGQGGASKANTGILHAGYDPLPGTLMARLCVRGNALYDRICADLGIQIVRNGTLVVAMSVEERSHLDELLQRGLANGVSGMRVLTRDELLALEPRLNPKADSALFAGTGGTVEPYEVTIVLAENAAVNGVEFLFESPVRGIRSVRGSWEVAIDRRILQTRFIVNAAGLFADDISAMAGAGDFTLYPRRGEYVLIENQLDYEVHRPVFQVPTTRGKGIVVSRTVDGTIIAGPTADDGDDKESTATTTDGLARTLAGARRSVPMLDSRHVIAQFVGNRAVMKERDDFLIEIGAPRFVNVAGIKSPGLTAAPAIAEYVVGLLGEEGLKLRKNVDFVAENATEMLFRCCSAEQQERMIAGDPSFGRIVCRCECVTEGDVVRAIRRPAGARTVDGVKFRTRAGMGRCQAGFCGPRVVDILARELTSSALAVTKCGPGSEILVGNLRPEGGHNA